MWIKYKDLDHAIKAVLIFFWFSCLIYMKNMFCLFVWGLLSHSRIFHSYGNITITSERLQIFYLNCSALMAIEQRGLFSVPHLLRERDTNTYCLAYISGAVTTCFYILDLSQLGIEHPTFRLWKGWIHNLTLRFMIQQIKLAFNTPFSINIEKKTIINSVVVL